MLRRAGRKPVLAAWKRSFRSTSLLPRPSFLSLKVTRPYLFVFALSGVTPRANTRTSAPRAARPFASDRHRDAAAVGRPHELRGELQPRQGGGAAGLLGQRELLPRAEVADVPVLVLGGDAPPERSARKVRRREQRRCVARVVGVDLLDGPLEVRALRDLNAVVLRGRLRVPREQHRDTAPLRPRAARLRDRARVGLRRRPGPRLGLGAELLREHGPDAPAPDAGAGHLHGRERRRSEVEELGVIPVGLVDFDVVGDRSVHRRPGPERDALARAGVGRAQYRRGEPPAEGPDRSTTSGRSGSRRRRGRASRGWCRPGTRCCSCTPSSR